jgi:predicted secreted protein
MGLVTSLAIYFVIWWTVLFVVLPFGMRSQIEDGEIVLGSAHGAPSRFSFARIALITTVVAAAVFALFYFVTEILGYGPDSFPHIVPGT